MEGLLTAKSFPIALPTAFPPPPDLNHLLLSTTAIPHLKQIHAQFLRTTLNPSALDLSAPFLSKLLSSSFSSSTSCLDYALSVLLHSSKPDAGRANHVLSLLSRTADPRRTLAAYIQLRRGGITLDRFSLPTVLRAAARAGRRDGVVAREVHGLAAKLGLDSDVFVQTAVVGAYSALGRAADARRMFERMPCRDLVAWSVMLDGYCQSGQYNEALLLFDDMRCSGVVPDQAILATVLSACGRTRNLSLGRAVHSYIIESNLSLDMHLQSALINMYSNCGIMDVAQRLYNEMSPKNQVALTAIVSGYAKLGKIDIARSVFDQMSNKDLVCWSAMISGYAESEQANEALKLFNEMQNSGIKPDQITMLSIISACANLGALDQAKWVDIFVNKNGFHDVLSIRNALIDMYCKCGSLADACKIFDETPSKNVITWTSMISGFAMHGKGKTALDLFARMKTEGVQPNGVTFISLLYACSHSGLVSEGQRIFQEMVHEHQIEPKHEHYGCLVDLLGRARLLQEAFELIKSMPFNPNVVVWGSLLGACKIHKNIELGEVVAKRLLEVDPNHDGAYVLLSNIYAKANRWNEVRKVRELMNCKRVTKEWGYSWIELNGCVHEFVMGDKSHVKSSEIYAKLEEIVKEMEAVGYIPNIESVLVDLSEEEKKVAVLLHSEKLALSWGLINSRAGSCIRIAKNLRVCEDCHTFMKVVSQLFDREIVLRDRTRFHHYKDGACSCGDFW